jgi:hypothetical protein
VANVAQRIAKVCLMIVRDRDDNFVHSRCSASVRRERAIIG